MGKETEQIRFKKLSPAPAICVYHKGPYDTLGEAYAFAYQWVKENGYRPIQGAREHYIDGMWNKENHEEWLTEDVYKRQEHAWCRKRFGHYGIGFHCNWHFFYDFIVLYQ